MKPSAQSTQARHSAKGAQRGPEATEAGYIPGVCNIGEAELRVRRLWAFVSIVLTAALFAWLLVGGADPAWMLLLFLPALAAGIGWLQVRNRFCVHYGLFGRFNFGRLGRTNPVGEAGARRRDRARVRQLFLRAAGMAAGFTGAAVAAAAILP